VAAPLARRHVARAAWASAGRPLPPLPADAGDVAHHAAITIGGTLAAGWHAGWHAAITIGGRVHAMNFYSLALAV
jgi:hypothetical protein